MTLWTLHALLLLTVVIVAVSYGYYERKTGVPTFPTLPAMRRRMLELLTEDMGARAGQRPYRILDLGSGSGQLSWRIARALPEAEVTGLELSYIPWLRSILRQGLRGPKNLTYLRADFWPYDVTGMDAVITYLPGRIMERVGQKLRAELKPDTLILSNAFPLRAGWQPLQTLEVRTPFTMKLFVYRQSP